MRVSIVICILSTCAKRVSLSYLFSMSRSEIVIWMIGACAARSVLCMCPYHDLKS